MQGKRENERESVCVCARERDEEGREGVSEERIRLMVSMLLLLVSLAWNRNKGGDDFAIATTKSAAAIY
jgi:hypothetical protein